MTGYFTSLFEHFATKKIPELSMLFLDLFFQIVFHCKYLITTYTHIHFYSYGFYVINTTLFF